MEKFDKKIVSSIEQDPACDRLNGLSHDVWQKIRETGATQGAEALFNFTLTPAIKAFSLVLLLGSCLALSQISFDNGSQPDLFDLRYFSHQSLATTNLLSMSDRGLLQ